MAAFHARSNSFPSSESHFVVEIKEQLNRISSSKAASSSSSEIYHKLSSLLDLHDSIDKLLTQKAFSKEQNGKYVDELLDGSIRILDLCGVANDALQMTKESVQELQSNIRRKIEAQENYSTSRKTVKKAIKKAFESLKGMQKNKILSSPIDEKEASATLAVLREVEATTLCVFESLFSFVLAQSRPKGWSLVSKLMQQRKASSGEETENEFEKVDVAVNKTSKSENVQEKLKDLEMCVEDLEESLERLNRRLIKTRVSLLNILND